VRQVEITKPPVVTYKFDGSRRELLLNKFTYRGAHRIKTPKQPHLLGL
jgi:hypothetical protein